MEEVSRSAFSLGQRPVSPTVLILANDGPCALGGSADSTRCVLRSDSELIFPTFDKVSHSKGTVWDINVVGLHPRLRRQIPLLDYVPC